MRHLLRYALALLCMLALSNVRASATTITPLPEGIAPMVRLPSTYTDALVLTGGTAKSVTTPTLTDFPNALLTAVFSADCADFYVKVGGTAAAPSGDVTDGTASERNPTAYLVAQGVAISVESPTSCKVTIAIYRKRGA